MISLQQLQAALQGPLPGVEAMRRMAPLTRALYPPEGEPRPRVGAVLVLLYPQPSSDELYLVLTRRTDTVGNHRGQISFPGGSVDAHDASPAHAALREACEEIGACTDDLRLLGALTPLYIPPSHFHVSPYVAYAAQRPHFIPQPGEVAELIEAPLHLFAQPDSVGYETRVVLGQTLNVPYFRVLGHQVWGATAMILAELAALVQSAI
ncbi:MAG: CoA pyrophosphatase [Caldilineales bacterium]